MSPRNLASRQRQILSRLRADLSLLLRDILQPRQLLKGSLYQLQTRCGKPSCHCASRRGRLHSSPVLSWSQAGKTRVRSVGAEDIARYRRLAEDYRRFRQSRAALVKLQRRILVAIDRLEKALRVPPPPPAKKRRK